MDWYSRLKNKSLDGNIIDYWDNENQYEDELKMILLKIDYII